MPLLQVIRNRPGGAGPSNDYEGQIIASGGDHYWPFNAQSGDFPDQIGTLEWTPQNSANIHRGLVGPVIGAPYVPAIRSGTNESNPANGGWLLQTSLSNNFDDAQTTGAFGGFFKLGDVSNVGTGFTDGFPCFICNFSATPSSLNSAFSVFIRTDGNVWVIAALSSSSIYARWRTTSQPFADGDWHHLTISQPGDGGGVRIYIDGVAVPVTFNQASFTGNVTPNQDWWLWDLKNRNTSGGTSQNRAVSAFWIAGRGANNDSDRTQATSFSGLFWKSGGSGLTASQVFNIVAASNFLNQGAVAASSYEEFVLKLFGTIGPNHWIPSWAGRTANNWQYSPLVNSQNWSFAPNGVNTNKLPPSQLPGFKYEKRGFLANGVSPGTSIFNRNPFATNLPWTTGSWFLICEVPGGTNQRCPVQYVRGSGGPSRIFDLMRLTFVGAARNLRMDVWFGATFGTNNPDGDGWRLQTNSASWSPGDIISIAIVQPGDGTNPIMYVNGDPASTTLTFTGSGATNNPAIWHSDINVIQFVMGRGDFVNDFEADIWDFFEDEAVLAAADVKSLHDLAFGNVTQATPS